MFSYSKVLEFRLIDYKLGLRKNFSTHSGIMSTVTYHLSDRVEGPVSSQPRSGRAEFTFSDFLSSVVQLCWSWRAAFDSKENLEQNFPISVHILAHLPQVGEGRWMRLCFDKKKKQQQQR